MDIKKVKKYKMSIIYMRLYSRAKDLHWSKKVRQDLRRKEYFGQKFVDLYEILLPQLNIKKGFIKQFV